MDITNYKKPELLAPAGDLEKLKTAVLYGANAVYIGGKNYGLRTNAKNFTEPEMEEGVKFAHENGAKVYAAANIYARNADLDGIARYFKFLLNIGADAAIVSDPGVFALARANAPGLEIHISVQANVTNYAAAAFWRDLGAKRVILSRELTLEEISCINVKMSECNVYMEHLETEAFVHGAMCVSYSGRCLLSDAMTGRSANLGECAHPCRYSYALMEETRPGEYFPIEEDARGSYILSSKDLCMIEHIPELVRAGVSSFKIEGRVKTPFYVGSVVKAYREAIDDFYADPSRYDANKLYYNALVNKASHREHTTGFFFGNQGRAAQQYDEGGYIKNYEFVGIVKSYDGVTGYAAIEQRGKFSAGDEIEFLQRRGRGFTQVITEIIDDRGVLVESAPHAKQIIRVKTDKPVLEYDMMIKRC